MNFDLPTKDEADVTGNCTEDTRVLSLTWWQGFSNFTASFRFAVTQSEWYLSQVDIDFDVDNDTFESPEGVQVVCDACVRAEHSHGHFSCRKR